MHSCIVLTNEGFIKGERKEIQFIGLNWLAARKVSGIHIKDWFERSDSISIVGESFNNISIYSRLAWLIVKEGESTFSK